MSEKPVSIGVLVAGRPPAGLEERWGSYADMMASLLGEGFLCRAFDVQRQELPDRPEDYSGYIITGSAAGAYDDLPWIASLEAFLRRARGKAKLVGICFGHQIMAQAFGGKVAKSDKGWGLGLHTYTLAGSEGPIAIAAVHQDQVMEAPHDAQVLGCSAFTPHGVLAYGGDALSFQCHPEFEPAYAAALVDYLRPRLSDQAAADAWIASLESPNDRARVGKMIRDFLAGTEELAA